MTTVRKHRAYRRNLAQHCPWRHGGVLGYSHIRRFTIISEPVFVRSDSRIGEAQKGRRPPQSQAIEALA